jgi:hypothetical protein
LEGGGRRCEKFGDRFARRKSAAKSWEATKNSLGAKRSPWNAAANGVTNNCKVERKSARRNANDKESKTRECAMLGSFWEAARKLLTGKLPGSCLVAAAKKVFQTEQAGNRLNSAGWETAEKLS